MKQRLTGIAVLIALAIGAVILTIAMIHNSVNDCRAINEGSAYIGADCSR